jgi:exonuclease III
MLANHHCTVLSWNMRGLNNLARRQVVRDLIADIACTTVCLQETKLQTVDDVVITTPVGPQFLDQVVVLLAQGTHGGIILSCSRDYYTMSQIQVWHFSLTMIITRRIVREVWTLIGVYAPRPRVIRPYSCRKLGQSNQQRKSVGFC